MADNSIYSSIVTLKGLNNVYATMLEQYQFLSNVVGKELGFKGSDGNSILNADTEIITFRKDITTDTNVTTGMLNTYNILPRKDSTYDIGSDQTRYAYIYADNIQATNIVTDSQGKIDINAATIDIGEGEESSVTNVFSRVNIGDNAGNTSSDKQIVTVGGKVVANEFVPRLNPFKINTSTIDKTQEQKLYILGTLVADGTPTVPNTMNDDGTSVYIDNTGVITATSFTIASSRKAKENIQDTAVRALDLINNLKIVDYTYIADPSKTPHIGFIAEDTPELLSTPKQNKMDYTNCIGVLLKAVQELSSQVAELQTQISTK